MGTPMTDLLKDLEAVALLPCPFCGGAAEYKSARYGGTGASGMEAPYISAGCRKCNVWFGGGQTDGPWDLALKKWEDRSAEAHAEAANRWNTRIRTHHAEIAEAVNDAKRWRIVRELDGGAIYHVLGDCDGIHHELADAAIDAHNRAREDGE